MNPFNHFIESEETFFWALLKTTLDESIRKALAQLNLFIIVKMKWFIVKTVLKGIGEDAE